MREAPNAECPSGHKPDSFSADTDADATEKHPTRRVESAMDACDREVHVVQQTVVALLWVDKALAIYSMPDTMFLVLKGKGVGIERL